MHKMLLSLLFFIITLLPSAGNATDRLRRITVTDSVKPQSVNRNTDTYRGYYIDLSEIDGRQNFDAIADALRHQLDIVESVGLSPSVLKSFHTVPIVVGDEVVCLDRAPELSSKYPRASALACYGPHRQGTEIPVGAFTVWDSGSSRWTNPDPIALAEDTGRGVVMVRSLLLDARQPVVLHELLHAYHNNAMPKGIQNPDILDYYNRAKGVNLYPSDAYLLTNQKEYFALTVSVFLYGKAAQEPFTRSILKEKEPDYYGYLVRLFGFDPNGAPSASPVASAN
jgi:hypothetical protein